MPRFKESKNILSFKKDGEIFDQNWFDNRNNFFPPTYLWQEKRSPRFEEIDVWEVITEISNTNGFIGVYAAWTPYADYYVIMSNWSIIKEFSGPNANKELEIYMTLNNIPFAKVKDKKQIEEFSSFKTIIV